MTEIRTVIAVTGEDDRFEPIRRAAIDRALEDHATLILYDLDAPASPLESPVPTGWSAEGTEEDVGDRLGPEELEAAGREAIARQVKGFVFLEAPVGKDPDQRNYIVSNAKIEATGWRPKFSLDRGIEELVKGFSMIRNSRYGNV
jgi:hypothetical protein